MARPLYFAAVVFMFFLSFFLFLVYSQRSQAWCLPYFHTWRGLSANLLCRSEMCCTRLAGNTGRKIYAKSRHLRTIAQLCRAISSQIRQVSTIGKKVLNNDISSTCPHNMVNFGPLAAEIDWWVWGTPSNFNEFGVLPSLLHRRRSTEVNQTLHNVWPSPALVHHIYTLGGSCPLTEFCHVQNWLCLQVLRSPILAGLLHGTRAVGVSQTAAFSRGCHLY